MGGQLLGTVPAGLNTQNMDSIKNGSPVRVLFDSQCFDMQRFGGVSRCFAELYAHLPADIVATVGVRGTHNVYLAALMREHFEAAHPGLVRRLWWQAQHAGALRLHSWRSINRAYALRLLRRGGFDVFHPTFFCPDFLPLLGDRPFVMTIHDMIPERLPEQFPDHGAECAAKRLMAQKAAHIIAVSAATRDDVIRLLGVPPERVSVIYHGATGQDYRPSQESPFATPYLLYVGARNDYKQFRPFVAATVPLLHRRPSLKVVCTGAPFSTDELAYFKALGVADRIVHHFVDDDHRLFDLYHFAEAFVYPSAIEGFGIPLLEAFRADCPVVAADTKCFREVAGDAALYFSPTLPPEAVGSLTDVLTRLEKSGTAGRKALLQRQRDRLAHYDWQRSAEQLAGIYHTVAGR